MRDAKAILEKRDELIAQEASEPEQWWWLSFADPKLPKGTQFLGVALIRASGFVTATFYANMLNLNPGGEIQGMGIPPEIVVPEEYQERLLTRAEVETLDAEFGKQMQAAQK